MQIEPWLFIIGLTCFVIFFAGLYPAQVLSKTPISSALQNTSHFKSQRSTFKKILVVTQFFVAQVLIVCSFVVTSQINLFLNKDLGYSKEAVISVLLPTTSENSYNKIYDELDKIPEVVSYAASDNMVTVASGSSKTYKFQGAEKGSNHVTGMRYGDENYLETFNIKLEAGRSYKKSDTLNEVVINKKMAKSMGYLDIQNAVNQSIFIGKKQVKISGVISDINFSPLHDEVGPLTIATDKRRYQRINIKLNSIKSSLDKIRRSWKMVYPNVFFDFIFVEDATASLYENEIRISKLFNMFAGIAIFISCLGLYGIVSFMANQKTKEVGIRKVLGASIPQIMFLLTVGFLKLVLLAFVIAVPISYFYMNEWLSEFTFRINIGIGIFVVAILTSMAIALVTMSYRSFQAATANPVDTLRS
jgi:ABC-type lipoprotein release transport system permease subunit